MNKQEIIDTLKDSVCEVTFTKVNGEVRTLPCTLRTDVLPERESQKTPRKTNSEVVAVWATDIGEWRSFRVDSVKRIEIV